MLARILLLCLGVLCLGSATLAQPVESTGPNPTEAMFADLIARMALNGPADADEPDREYPEFDEITEDMEAHEGLFTLWYYPDGTKGKDSQKLLCQIPSGFLGEKFMISTSFSGGGFFTGFPIDERVVLWEELGRQLVLVEPQTSFVTNGDHTVNDVVRRTYPDRIRTAVSIVTKSPGGDPVIDLGALLKSDFADIGWMTFGGGGINPSLSKWTKLKPFPHNVEIGVELAVGSYYPSGSYDKKLVHYSFWRLKETGYSPRIADDRIGYFLTTNQDWSKPTEARDLFNRYIDRWPLEKRDPSLDLCEPKQPIIFYIEKTVPVRFRRAVRDGILDWNKAFEKVGFLNAIVVRQQTDDNEWKDLDPEDMRYSFFRWIVSGSAFAMGPHRANPFTGEIYDADIIFDDSMVRAFERDTHRLFPSAAMEMKTNDPVRQAFLDKYPQWKRPAQQWDETTFGNRDEAKLREAMRQRLRERGRHACDYCQGMRQQMAVAGATLEGQPKEVIDRFLYDTIKETVTHEVGHTLGLRHNFKASSIYSLDEIKRRRTTDEPTCGSVMDYNPALFFKDNATEGHFATPTIGPYDYWAIEYGYRPFDGNYKSPHEQGDDETEVEEKDVPEAAPASAEMNEALKAIPKEALDKLPPEVRKMLESGSIPGIARGPAGGATSKPTGPAFRVPPSGEEGMLRDIASRAAEPELAYATDEDTMFSAPDPRTNRFDMGADPLEWARERIDLVNVRMESILDWAVKDAESWYHLRNSFNSLLFEKTLVLDYVGRWVGGQYFTRSHRGDPNSPAPFELVDPKTQREALGFIEQNLFTDDFFTFSPELLNHLAPSRWWHEGARVTYNLDYPIHDRIAFLQWWNLVDRLHPAVLRRLHDTELKTNAADKFTVAEYLQRLQRACWATTTNPELVKKGKWTDAEPFVSSITRSLQREYLGLIEPLVRTPPGGPISPDLHAMVKFNVSRLGNDLGQVLATGRLDFASEAHLTACKSRIDRMLDPELPEYSRFSMFGF